MASETKQYLVMLLIFLAANCMQHCVHGVSQVPCVFIFGDSLSDSGNNNELATTAKANFKPYGVDFPTGPTGRFTNGLTEIDFITQFLGFKEFIPPFANTSGSDILKGVNYASGGSGIRAETGTYAGAVISLASQLQNHKTIVPQITTRLGSNHDLAHEYIGKCLYYVNIGSNDYLANYFLPQLYPTSTNYTTEQYAQVLIEELSQHLLALHEIGARKFVLAGLGLLGCTLGEIYSFGTNGTCVAEVNAAGFLFNDKLQALVDEFNSKFSADSKFIFINTALKADHITDRNTFAFHNSACCQWQSSGECIADQTPCYNREEYVFFDLFHPTEKWNFLNAITSYDSTTDPDTAYPMDIKHLADYEIKKELELANESTSQLSATE